VTPFAAALLADLDVCEAAFSDERERSSLARIRNFVTRSPAAFSRANPEGHITASAVVARAPARIIHERLRPSRGSFPADKSSDRLCDAPGIAVVGLPRPDEKSLAGTMGISTPCNLDATPRSSLNVPHVFRPGVRELSGLDAAFLLVWHRKLARWLQPGGHMEASDASVFATALREAQEETGIEDFAFPIGDRILDVDVHPIPAHGPDPAHFHYDIRYLFTVEGLAPPLLDETAWFSLPQALAVGVDESLTRALRKAAEQLRGLASVPTTYHLRPTT
jgi:8-oxo-dGTP pyrophosphatase MutT (NUDIX family)